MQNSFPCGIVTASGQKCGRKSKDGRCWQHRLNLPTRDSLGLAKRPSIPASPLSSGVVAPWWEAFTARPTLAVYLEPVDELRSMLPVKSKAYEAFVESESDAPEVLKEQADALHHAFKTLYEMHLHEGGPEAAAALTIISGIALAKPLIATARKLGFESLDTNDRLRGLNAELPPLFRIGEDGFSLANPLPALVQNYKEARDRPDRLVSTTDPDVCKVIIEQWRVIDFGAVTAKREADLDLGEMLDSLGQDFLAIGYEDEAAAAARESGEDRGAAAQTSMVLALVYADHLDWIAEVYPEDLQPPFRKAQVRAVKRVAALARETAQRLGKLAKDEQRAS